MKKIHTYNKYKIELFTPSKLIHFSGDAETPELSDVPENPQNSPKFKEKFKETKDRLNQSFQEIKKTEEYAEFYKLDPKAAAAFVNKFKNETLGKDGEIGGDLDAAKNNTSGKTMKGLLSELDAIVIKFDSYGVKLIKKLEKETAKIKKERNAALKTFFNKTLPKDLVKDMVKEHGTGTGVSKEVGKQAMDYGSKLAMVGVDKLMKNLLYVPDAFKNDLKNPDKIIVNEMNKQVKPHVDKVDKAVEDLIEHEMERINAMPEEDKNTLLTYTQVNATVKENKETETANENFVRNYIEKKIKAGEKVTINISGNTSAEGDPKYNETLGKRRARAKKAAMIRALTKVMGNKWQGKVEFKITTQQITPKLKMLDLPSGFKTKYEKDKKYAEFRLTTAAKLQNAIKMINSIDNPAKKLNAMITLFAGKVNVKAVLREYNTYIRIKTNSKHEDAERWLQTKSKYLKNNNDLLIFLHKNVGRARSAEVRVVTPKKEGSKIAQLGKKGAHIKPEDIKAAGRLSKMADTLLYEASEYNAALKLYKEANSKNPNHNYEHQIAVCYRNLKNKEEALKHLNSALKLAKIKGVKEDGYFMAKLNEALDWAQPNHEKYLRYYDLAYNKFNKGQYKEALALFDKADSFDKSPRFDPNTYGFMAMCYSKLGNKKMAKQFYVIFKNRVEVKKGFEKKFSNFIALVKNSVEGGKEKPGGYKEYRRLFKEGIKKFDGGYYNEAIALYKKADTQHKTAKIHARIALCYKWLGNNQEALKHYRLFLKLAKKEKGFEDKPQNRALVVKAKKQIKRLTV